MRIAIISDIHGNLPAFEAAIGEWERRRPFDATVGGGDFSVGGVYPVECLTRVRAMGWAAVRGNTEEMVIAAAGDGVVPAGGDWPAFQLDGDEQERFGWFASALDDQLDYIRDLPLTWWTTGPSNQRLVFVHATPWSTHPVVLPDADEVVAQRMIDEADADILLYGHIHRAYTRDVDGRTLGCVGAVGAPLDGDERPCFAIAEDDGSGWTVTHVRVEYDRDAYLDELSQADFPGAEGMAATIRAAGRQ